jgi:hypothetical protein
MDALTLKVDERELSTILAALLLLQEQIDSLPEDLADMIREHGPPLTPSQIDELGSRLSLGMSKEQFKIYCGEGSGSRVQAA